MTKREHEAIQKYFNTMMDYRVKADAEFEKLQELNGTEGTGKKWCSAAANYKDLLSVGKDYTYIYDRYVMYNGMASGISELGSVLAELNFWK